MDCLFFMHYIFIQAYINNIIIFSNNFNIYVKYIKIIINIFNKGKVYINALKSFVAFLLVQLLKYNINNKNVTKINNRIKIFKKLEILYIFKAFKIYIKIASQLGYKIIQFNYKIKAL